VNIFKKYLSIDVLFAATVSICAALILLNRISSRQEADVSNVLGGQSSCTAEAIRYCDIGLGCNEICGWGPGPHTCPVDGQEFHWSPGLDPPAYYDCGTSTTGLTDCGFPTDVDCGNLEKCTADCTAGSPIGSLDPKPARCIPGTSEDVIKQSIRMSGDVCGTGGA
jgi:hypothetical protein